MKVALSLLFSLVFVVSLALPAQGQTGGHTGVPQPPKQEAIGGSALYASGSTLSLIYSYTVNYEYITYKKVLGGHFGIRTGAGFGGANELTIGGGTPDSFRWFMLPVSGKLLYGRGSHYFLIEGGLAMFPSTNRSPAVPLIALALPIAHIGYRYQKPGGGLLFQAGLGLSGVTLGLGYAF